MFQIAVVIFREFLEISILIGLFSAAARGIKDYRIILTSGILLGAFGSGLLAMFTEQISDSLDGTGSEFFESCILLTTVALIISTIIWMKNYSKKLKNAIDNTVHKIEDGNISKLVFIGLISSTIFREGAEIALIMHSIITIQKQDAYIYLGSFISAAILGISFGYGIYKGILRFAGKYIFKISSILLCFIAAGLSAEAAKKLTSIGILNFYSNIIWDSSHIIEDQDMLGKFLKVMVGYTSRPSGIELIFYLSTILIILLLSQIFSGKLHNK